MKKIATWLFATVGGIVLLFSYKTSTEAAPAAPDERADTSVAAPEAPSAAGPSPGASPDTPAAPGAEQAPTALRDGVYTGSRQETKYGPVQVLVSVSGGRVTGAVATVFPSGTARTDQVNADAIPRLQSATVGTVDGQIDMVTGATFTSAGYIGSLQEAIDQARP